MARSLRDFSWCSPHSAGSEICRFRLMGAIAGGGDWLPKSSSFPNRKPFTSPKIAGITIRVSKVDEIMPPIIGTAMRCMISEPAPVLPHDRQQACHDGDHRHHLRPHTLDRTFHDGVVRSPRVSARPSMSRRNLISASAWFR
jgi:hypothetical protein